jgi:hypothetical protein
MKPALVTPFSFISRAIAYPPANTDWLAMSEDSMIFGVNGRLPDAGTYQAVLAQTGSSDAGMASLSSDAPSATMSTFCWHSARAAASASVGATLPRLMTVQPFDLAKVSASSTKLS